ncbi:unnamed protein product [Sphagnum jensenii]
MMSAPTIRGCNFPDAQRTRAEVAVSNLAQAILSRRTEVASPDPPTQEEAKLRRAVAAMLELREPIEADLRSAHSNRGNGASEWMRENDKEFRREVSEAKLALALYDRAGKVLTKEFALEVLYPNPDEAAEQKIISVLVCKIRTKLIYYCGDQKPIDTVRGRGYQMSPAGMAIFAQALGEAPLSAAQQPPFEAAPAVQEQDDAYELKEALRDLVMLKAQADIGCVPPPTKEQWAKAWGVAEELVRIEP